jgi:hypothetical protein
MQRQGRFLRVLLIFPLYFLTMVVVHELGHALSAAYLVPGEIRLYVWPGYELYPDWGRQFPETWPERSPAMTYVLPDTAPGQWRFTPGVPPYAVWNDGGPKTLERNVHLTRLMGSASTLLFALAALTLLTWLKPRGLMLWLLAAGALLHLDILTGTVFPVFFDARHLYFWGSSAPEAVDALAGIGVPAGVAITAIGVLSLLQSLWLYYLLALNPRRPVPAS